MPAPRTSETIALERKIGEESGRIKSRYGFALSRHGYSAEVTALRKTLTEAALASKGGHRININLRKPDGTGIKLVYSAEAAAILSAVGLGASKVIELMQSAPDSLPGLLTKLGIGILVGGGTLVTTITFAKLRRERKQSEQSIREAIAEASAKIPGEAEALQKSLDEAEHETYKRMANLQIRRALKNAAYRFNDENIELLNKVIAHLIEVLSTPSNTINTGIEADLKEKGLLSGSIFSNSVKIAGPDYSQNITQEQRLRAILEIIQHGRNSFIKETEV